MRFFILTTLALLRIFTLAAYEYESNVRDAHYHSNESETSYHKGVPYCQCFVHCKCFGRCVGDYDGCFPPNTSKHPKTPIDCAWHEFMKGILTARKVGPFFTLDAAYLRNLIGYRTQSNVLSIADYLEVIEKFRYLIANAKTMSIALHQDLYSSPHEKAKLKENLNRIDQEYRAANQILDEIPSRIIPLYQQTIRNCSHASVFSIYNQGLIHSLEGNWEEAIDEMRNLLNATDSKFVNSIVYQSCGEACLEINLFNEAIDALTNAINKDPENNQAYFFRAAAYFESGNFDQALQDYLMSDQGKSISTVHQASDGFTKALIASTRKAASEAVLDFFPSFCSSMYGLNRTLWAIHWSVNPLNPQAGENVKHFADACYEAGECIVEYCKNMDENTLNECITEIKTLYKHFEQLSDKEKGKIIGSAIGTYGTDILMGSLTGVAVIKGPQLVVNSGMSAFRKLKNINRACNMDAMVVSNANKKAVASSALQHAIKRESYFENIKLEIGKQNKHIAGTHNVDPKKSIFEHSNPEYLLKKYAGKGRPGRGKIGEPGYQEIVDFEEFIGYNVCPATGAKTPTTWGKIHYSKDGAHIVPTMPRK